MEPEYVFIVGLPRTGTKLMMNVLENCQQKRCYITLENFFLGRVLQPGVRQKMRKIGDMSLDKHVHQLVEAMYTRNFFGAYWDRLADGRLVIDKEAMLQRILDSDRSDKAIYSILLQIHTGLSENEMTDGLILGDKSGPNLYRAPTLVEWFPEAKVVHTFRDPRAILASEHKKLLNKQDRDVEKLKATGKKNKAAFFKLTRPLLSLLVVLYITIAWLYAVRLHYKYKKRYPKNYYLSKFEDLVTEPEANVRKLCEFLEIEFHPTMLQPPKIDSSYSKKSGTGFDKQTLNRWKDYLKPWMSALLLLWGKKYLREFGYIR